MNVWSPTSNHTDDPQGKDNNRGRRIERYTSTKSLLMKPVEPVEEAKYSKSLAALDVCLGWVNASLRLDDRDCEKSEGPKTSALYLLSDRDCPAQVQSKDFEHGRKKAPAYFYR